MNKPPYFPFYVTDFVADDKVDLMSTLAIGAYTLLLCKAWHQEPPASLPNDDLVLSRFTRMTLEDWQAVKAEVLAAFSLGTDGRLHQKRLRLEYDKFAAKSKKAKESANKRWKKDQDANAYANALQTHCEGNARASGSGSDSGSEKIKVKENSARGSPEVFPQALDTPEFRAKWADWLAYRREYKLVRWKPGTVKRNLNALAEVGHDAAITTIDTAINATWKGLHPARGAKPSGGNPQASAEARRADKAGREYEQDNDLGF